MCLFFVSHSTFAVTALRTLLDAGLAPTAVIVPKSTREPAYIDDVFPIYRPHSLPSVCASAGVTLVEVDGIPSIDLLQTIAPRPVRYIVCLCFPFRLPKSILYFPSQGCLNLHPSLLPAYRGPAPIFWQLHAGEVQSAVTLHHMNPSFDAGDIVAQTGVEIPNGISARELEQAMATKGAALIREAVAGSLRKSQAQDETQASYFSWPKEQAFEIETTWPAERVFRFMRGTREMGQRYAISIGAERFSMTSALMYSAQESLRGRYEKFGADMRIQFSPGVVHVVLSDSS